MSGLRFLLVGACSEVLYLALYALIVGLGGSSGLAIALAGGVCLLLNGFLHARFSFRVRYHWRLQLDYLLIQLLGLALALASGSLLQRLGWPPALIGPATLVPWAATSFLLTRWRYRRRGAEGLASRHTSQAP